MSQAVYMDSDTMVRWDAMRRFTDNDFVNTATVNGLLEDASGDTVDGSAFSMPYTSGSSGRYQGVIVDTLSLTEGARYTIVITAFSGTLKAVRRVPVIAQFRGAS